ncbi:MAG TPA: DNA-3-methyladenine glycosylase [Candidatus Acidoferrum sp.]|jgi:DNA-3-methyladenine glycosylase|nr:DNA-3-methyladenine glycosylase [Candidatus Acidoferrum sp.]
MTRRLRRKDLPIDTVELARFLVGKMLVHDLRGQRASGRIVETEAYPVGDAAGHAFRGKTQRNAPLYLARGHAYVYFIYGMYYCLNVSSERAGVGAGVLIRALEPLEGIDLMKKRRGTSSVRDLARGPGRLAVAMAIDMRDNGLDLCADPSLWLGVDADHHSVVGATTRIGLSREQARRWRFYERGNTFVSGPRIPNGH